LRSCVGSTSCIWDYPFAGNRMLRDLFAWRRRGDWPGAGRHADAADGDRGDLAQNRTRRRRRWGAQKSTRICCAGWRFEQPNQVWAMDITYIPDGAGVRLSGGGARLVQPAGPFRGGCRSTMGRRFSASKQWKRLSPVTDGPKFSITDQGKPVSPVRRSHGLLLENAIRREHGWARGAWRDKRFFVERLWRVGET